MEMTLNEIEARILGCLIEKDLATPEYYPLTLNALTNACNQKSNRSPVMALSEAEVQKGLDGLRRRQFAHTSAEGVRSTKYCHNLEGLLKLDPAELAILAELLVRGPQTVGELRSRAERMHAFPDLEEIEQTLQGLLNRDQPLVVKLPRQPGRKEHRFAHLLSGIPQAEEQSSGVSLSAGPVCDDRLLAIEEEIATLRSELEALQNELAQFKSQFD